MAEDDGAGAGRAGGPGAGESTVRPAGDDPDLWVEVTESPLPFGEAANWVIRPDCGAVVTFAGTVRDHSPGRSGVTCLEYEAYPEVVLDRLAALAATARQRWPVLGRIALLHRVGRLELCEVSVVVAVSSPNRPESFAAGRFLIDALKASVPIWKRETWEAGSDWSVCDHPIVDLDDPKAVEELATGGVSPTSVSSGEAAS